MRLTINNEGKGILNNRISEHILSALKDIGIQNHYKTS